jgi:hypothetical protein
MSPRATTRQNISTQTWIPPQVPAEPPRCVNLCPRRSAVLQAIQEPSHFVERGTLALPMTQISWRAARQYAQGTDMLAESIPHSVLVTVELPFLGPERHTAFGQSIALLCHRVCIKGATI